MQKTICQWHCAVRGLRMVRKRMASGIPSTSMDFTANEALSTREQVKTKTGLFGNELLTEPVGFVQLNKRVKTRVNDLVNRLHLPCSGRAETTVRLFDDISNEICCAADLAECTRMMHSDPAYCEAAENSMRDFTELVESMNTDFNLYNALRISRTTEANRLDEIDRRTIELFLADFEQSGVQLPERERQEFVQLGGQIFDAGSRFTSAADRSVPVPKNERKRYNCGPLLTGANLNAPSREVRKWCHSTFLAHEEKQEAELKRLITSRHRLAQLTGYQSYAHRAQQFSLLGTYENAHRFLSGIIQELRSPAEEELSVLLGLLQEENGTSITRIGEWDLHYLMNQYRIRTFGQSEGSAPFFTLDGALFGFGQLVDRLYGIELLIGRPEPGEIWPGNVIKINVTRSEEFLGTIYCDLERSVSKAVGDCHYTVKCSKLLSTGRYQTPIVVLSLSYDVAPDADRRDLRNVYLTSHQVENFFHEMGHAMHSMLGRTRYQHVAGTRCPADLAEIPSHLMEYFVQDWRTLALVGRSNGDEQLNLSEREGRMIIRSRSAFSAIEIVQQAIYALFDLEAHGPKAESIVAGDRSTTDLYAEIWQQSLPSIERDSKSAWHHRFTHLVPYGAKYYSYLVARAAASLIWKRRFKADPFSRISGQLWADVQSYGGALPPADLLELVLGKVPTGDDLIQALKEEIVDNSIV